MGYLFHALVEASSVIFTYQLSIFRIDNRKINFKLSIQKLHIQLIYNKSFHLMQISIVCNLINKSFFRSSRVENSKLQKFQKLCFINAILKMNNNNTKKRN